MATCCITGFQWNGVPTGTEGHLGDHKAYITGNNKQRAIMVIHDVFGWTFNNTRLLADYYAREVDATVYLPDFFGGEILSPEILRDESRHSEIDLPAFWQRNSKAVRAPEIIACALTLRTQYQRFGAIGFCFGGWAVFRLGSKAHSPPLVDCISTAHPSILEDDEMENVAVPVQIMAAEHDAMFPLVRREAANKIIPLQGVSYDFQYFPGSKHGFATRGDVNDKLGKQAMLRAASAAVSWIRLWLYAE